MTAEDTQPRLTSSRYCTLTTEGMIEIRPDGPTGHTYRIRLDELDRLYKLQDWIRHLAIRTGYTAEVIGDLVTFHARLSDPMREHEGEIALNELLTQCSLDACIQRDSDGLAVTRFCRETLDRGLDIMFKSSAPPYQLSPERIADGPALGQTLLDLRQKHWFTDEIQTDLTNVVTARWLAKDRGWI